MPKQETFDLKATHEKITGYLQKQVDEALTGTSMKLHRICPCRTGSRQPGGPESSPCRSRALRRTNGGAAQVPAFHQASSPVELHGVVELEAPDYTLALDVTRHSKRARLEGSVKLKELVATVLKRPDLEMRASLSAKGIASTRSRLQNSGVEVDDIISRSHLKSSQWSMQTTPTPAEAPAEATPSARCSSRPQSEGLSAS